MGDLNSIKDTGLRDVTVASTNISDVNGAEGKLIYRGYLVKDLAEKTVYEEIVYLLLYEKLPNNEELALFKKTLAKERSIPGCIIDALKTFPKDALPMDVLQSSVAMLAPHDPDIGKGTREATEKSSLRIIAKMATLVAAWERIRNGKEAVAPREDLSHAADFLYMMTGVEPDPETARFFDTGLVLHAEHAFNASTFTARGIASTQAHIYASIAGAVGSLSGPLHGGANTRVMKMLLEIGTPDKVDDYLNKILDSGGKIMGLGHAVYKVDDPRAHILAPMSKIVGEKAGDTKWYEMSKLLEVKAKEAFKKKKGRDINVNVDFYSASLYYSMNIPMDLFTPIFAISRAAGWTAHVIEEQFAGASPKAVLYRPESDYTGSYCGPDECSFVPLDERK